MADGGSGGGAPGSGSAGYPAALHALVVAWVRAEENPGVVLWGLRCELVRFLAVANVKLEGAVVDDWAQWSAAMLADVEAATRAGWARGEGGGGDGGGQRH